MTHIEDLKKIAGDLAAEGGRKVEKTATEILKEGVASLETKIEAAADELEEEIHEALNPRRKIPWLGIATGIAVAAGVIYLARHRSQRQSLQRGVVRGLEFVGDKIPVRVVMK